MPEMLLATAAIAGQGWDGRVVLIEDGDIIDIAIRALTLDVERDILAKRRARWTPLKPRVTTGLLARYAIQVRSASEGAILRL